MMTKWREKLLLILSWSAGLTVCGAVGTLTLFLLERGVPVLGKKLFFGSTPALDALLGLRPVWDGIWSSVVGTFCLLFMTLTFAVLPGVGCGIFLACYAAPRQKKWLGLAVDLLAGIPSIVMGLFGFVLIVSLRRTFLPQGTTCLLLASFCLALLVLPSLVAGTRTALETLPERLFLTTAALGFSYGQMVRWILLPAAGQGILGGVMLAMGRAAEDTAVIMMTGVVANAGLPSGFTAKFEALPFRIYYTAAQYADQQELQLGFGTALVLLCLSGSLLFCAWVIQRRWERRWKGIRK